MEKRWILLAVLLALLLMMTAAQAAEDTVPFTIDEIGVQTAFPAQWQVVTPDTAGRHLSLLGESTAEVAAANMRAEGVYAVAFAPQGDAMLRVIAAPGDDTMALYYDIERYTPAMRTSIKNDFLNKSAWALTGYRYSQADWTNKEGQGRILNLTYTIRFDEETVARGLQAYTIRNGLAFTLDLQIKGSRKISAEEEKIFKAFVADTAFPISLDMPLFSVGLALSGIVPEETNKAELTLRGTTTKGATVSAWLLPEEGDMAPCGEVTANNSGNFSLDIVLPEEGEWRVAIRAELEGYASSEEGRWISYSRRRLPVTFTSYPEGDVYDTQILIEGKTVSGVTVQCMEGDTNKKTTTGSGGTFSFKMDRGITGERTIVLSLMKKGYEDRRFTITFNRLWHPEDYARYLTDKVQTLSFKNLSENAEKYMGRLVKYDGEVLDISRVGERVYVQLGIKSTKEGRWTERLIAVGDGLDVTLDVGDRASLYVEVTSEIYAFSEVTLDGDQVDIDLPSVRLLTYQRKS